jgi:putative ABC transport system permease protein
MGSGFLSGMRNALRAIRRNALRASLTVLGIMIGITAVVAVTALAAGARDSIGKELDSIGSNFMVVYPDSNAASGAKGARGSGHRLTEEDGRAILREAVSVKALAPWLAAQGQVVFGDNNWQTMVGGTLQGFQEVKDWHVARGEIWTEHDEATKAKVCVIGQTVADKLFGSIDPIGQMIRIGRYAYRVVGVLEKKGASAGGGEDQDDLVLMPIGSLRSRILRTPPGFVGIFLVSATSPDTLDRAADQIRSILRQRHNIAEDAQPDFGIFMLRQVQEVEEGIFKTLTWVLLGVATISLIVGGIGVMNIMLVSVTERTREIGIRMAIGAQAADIRTQFLVEAVLLSILGGAAGAALGTVITAVVARILDWPMHVNVVALVVSLVVSGLTGVVFGFFPAQRASELDPILALHHE